MRAKLVAAYLLTVVLSFTLTEGAKAGPGLGRIGVRQTSEGAEFFNTASGRVFAPEGSNYVIFDPVVGPLCEFHPGIYDPIRAGEALTSMQQLGYNVVRIAVAMQPCVTPGGVTVDGVGGSQNGSTPVLSAAYLENVFDFIAQASDHRVYVIPVLSALPYTAYYQGGLNADLPILQLGDGRRLPVGGRNRFYLSATAVSLKQTYVREFIETLRSTRPDLLSAIFAYEIENEVTTDPTEVPFSHRDGTITTADGQSYDMANTAMSDADPSRPYARSRQQCVDANMVRWANAVAAAVRSVDPAAMVSASVFTFWASGRMGPDGVSPRLTTPYPARPAALAAFAGGLSYADVHLYPASAYEDVDAVLATSEFRNIPARVPILLGEFNTSPVFQGTPTELAGYLRRLREGLYARRFQGALMWTWDSATSGDGALALALAPSARVSAASSLPTAAPFLAVDDDNSTSWISGAFSPSWIEVDLGRSRRVSSIRMVTSQSPDGITRHDVYGGMSRSQLMLLGSTPTRTTRNQELLEVKFTARSLRYVRVVTRRSPSWVAWSELWAQ